MRRAVPVQASVASRQGQAQVNATSTRHVFVHVACGMWHVHVQGRGGGFATKHGECVGGAW
eukprot:4981130-Prymnesium_polylepis.1